MIWGDEEEELPYEVVIMLFALYLYRFDGKMKNCSNRDNPDAWKTYRRNGYLIIEPRE